jgi:hypothetical protein
MAEALESVIEFLEKSNEDLLAAEVIKVYEKRSTNLEQVNLLAKLALDVQDRETSERLALRVLGLCITQEQTYNARANLAKLYNNINQPEKSLFHSNLNQLVNPTDVDTLLEKVFSLYLLGRKRDAEDILRELKANEDQLSEHHQDIVNFNLGTYDLEQGKFLEGLKGFMLKGRKLNIWFSPRQLPYKFWDGGVFVGKTIILFAEGGGIGDEMLSVRFMDDIKKLGMNPVYYTSRPDLANIFNRCGYKTITDLNEITEDADNVLWTYFMQVPIYLESSVESIKRIKYLYPSNEAKDKFAFMKGSKKLKIGVRWQGNAKNERDLHRKVPLDGIMKTLHAAFDGKDVEYYSLQIGDGAEEAVNYPELKYVDHLIDSYDDTLAILENLDLVITSCTSVLHASAIVGTKTLAMIPLTAYFTWVSPSPNDTSIWYEDNLKLYRQQETRNWDAPFKKLESDLKSLYK